MKFKLPRQSISSELQVLGSKKIRRGGIYVPKATKRDLKGIAAVSRQIRKRGLPKHLVLKKLKGKLGYGIFLHPQAKPILKGEVIAPYAGEVFVGPQNEGEGSDYAFALLPDLLLTKEEQRTFDPKRKFHPRRLYSMDLDADKKGNFTRFINHSTKPNVAAEFLRIPSNSLNVSPAPFEIIYIASKEIRPGEQLLVCYEDEAKSYWGALGIKPFPMTPKTFQIS